MKILPYTRKIQFYETDQMGVIHHSNYVRWLEEARVDYMEQMGYTYEKVNDSHIDFALLSVYCEYKSPCRFGETVKIHLKIESVETARMALSYKIVDAETGMLRTIAETKHCYFHNVRQRPVSLKKELPELYEMFVQQKNS